MEVSLQLKKAHIFSFFSDHDLWINDSLDQIIL